MQKPKLCADLKEKYQVLITTGSSGQRFLLYTIFGEQNHLGNILILLIYENNHAFCWHSTLFMETKAKMPSGFWAGKVRTAGRPSTAYCFVVCQCQGAPSHTRTQRLSCTRSTCWHDCSSGSRGIVNADYWHELIAIPICDANPTPRRAFRASGQWRSWKYRSRQLFPAHQDHMHDHTSIPNSNHTERHEGKRNSWNVFLNARSTLLKSPRGLPASRMLIQVTTQVLCRQPEKIHSANSFLRLRKVLGQAPVLLSILFSTRELQINNFSPSHLFQYPLNLHHENQIWFHKKVFFLLQWQQFDKQAPI